jgi:hypothetical protein
MNLIYINLVGINFRNLNIYEFLFTTTDIQEVEGEDWDSYPAAGNPAPPTTYVESVYRFETEISLELIQNHESFDMADCKQGVIALAWEEDKEESIYSRLFFSYGEELTSVEAKFYERDIQLEKIYENAK